MDILEDFDFTYHDVNDSEHPGNIRGDEPPALASSDMLCMLKG